MRNVTRAFGIGIIALNLFGCSLHKWAPLNEGTAGSGGEDNGGAGGDGTVGGAGGADDGGTSSGGSSGGASPTGTTSACSAGYGLSGANCIALLSAITVSGGTLRGTFAPETTAYAASVNADTTTVSATSAVDGAVITIAGATTDAEEVTLSEPVTLVDVTVSALDASASYTVAISRFGAQQAYIKASNTGAGDQFGRSVALSDDGNTLAVGAPYEDSNSGLDPTNGDLGNSGAIYIYVRVDNAWQWQAYLKAPVPEAGSGFGWNVSLSADGNTLAAGARLEDTTINASVVPDAGAAYVFARSSGSWGTPVRLTAWNGDTNDRFGGDLALSGDGLTLAVGAGGEDSNLTGVYGDTASEVDGYEGTGAVYVYALSAGSWNQEAYIKAPNAGAGDLFGAVLDLSNNGNALVVAAPGETGNSTEVLNAPAAISNSDVANGQYGAAYVYTRIESTWAWSAYLKSPTLVQNSCLGWGLAISGDGRTIAALASVVVSTDPVCLIYCLGDSGWTYSAQVQGDQTSGFFETNVAISSDGTRLAVGAQEETNGTLTGAGAAYLFSYDGNSWSKAGRVTASNADASDQFGNDVALSGDGLTIAVGAYGEDSGGKGVDADYQSDNSATSAGAAYVFLF